MDIELTILENARRLAARLTGHLPLGSEDTAFKSCSCPECKLNFDLLYTDKPTRRALTYIYQDGHPDPKLRTRGHGAACARDVLADLAGHNTPT